MPTALGQVKTAGSDALQTVKEEGSTTASDLADTAKQGTQNVRQTDQTS